MVHKSVDLAGSRLSKLLANKSVLCFSLFFSVRDGSPFLSIVSLSVRLLHFHVDPIDEISTL